MSRRLAGRRLIAVAASRNDAPRAASRRHTFSENPR